MCDELNCAYSMIITHRQNAILQFYQKPTCIRTYYCAWCIHTYIINLIGTYIVYFLISLI